MHAHTHALRRMHGSPLFEQPVRDQIFDVRDGEVDLRSRLKRTLAQTKNIELLNDFQQSIRICGSRGDFGHGKNDKLLLSNERVCMHVTQYYVIQCSVVLCSNVVLCNGCVL